MRGYRAYPDPYLLRTSPSTFPQHPPAHDTESGLKTTFIRSVAPGASEPDEPWRASETLQAVPSDGG